MAFQLHHLAWSTARIANASPHVLMDVRIAVDDAYLSLGSLPAGKSIFLRLPKRGEASFSIEFSALGRRHRECLEYVEDEMYHVRVSIVETLETSCRVELGLGSRLMIWEWF